MSETKPQRDHNFFEQWARRNGMEPVERLTDVTVGGKPVSDVLIADSGIPIWRSEFPPVTIEHDLFVYYRTGYMLYRPGDKGGGSWVGCYADYPLDAFQEYSGDSRQHARIEDCKRNAAQFLAQCAEVGLFDGHNRKLAH